VKSPGTRTKEDGQIRGEMRCRMGWRTSRTTYAQSELRKGSLQCDWGFSAQKIGVKPFATTM
jgi:hypothetical protein